jgi:hypothetical protein
MTEQDITICHHGWRLEPIANVLGFGLSLSAVIAACCIGFFVKTVIPVENPAVLILASFFVLVPFKLKALRHSNETQVSYVCHSERSEESQSLGLTETLRFAQGDKRDDLLESTTTLQKIICFYLFCVVVNQISAQHFPISISSANINVSCNIVPLLLCGLGYLTTIATQQTVKRINISPVWITALAIIIIHIIFLSVILNKFYGYGYERNLSTVGNLMLYLLLFVLLWEKLGSHRFRRSMGLVLALFYLVAIFMNK